MCNMDIGLLDATTYKAPFFRVRMRAASFGRHDGWGSSVHAFTHTHEVNIYRFVYNGAAKLLKGEAESPFNNDEASLF